MMTNNQKTIFGCHPSKEPDCTACTILELLPTYLIAKIHERISHILDDGTIANHVNF